MYCGAQYARSFGRIKQLSLTRISMHLRKRDQRETELSKLAANRSVAGGIDAAYKLALGHDAPTGMSTALMIAAILEAEAKPSS
jgi:hypothetical protein